MTNSIPYGRQDINQADIDAVIDVLQSEFLTQGPVVPAFEEAVASACGVRYALAVNSATSALHIACLALGVCERDTVWTSPITFVASANAALYCGAKIDFVDIDPQTYNMSVNCLAEKLALAKAMNALPKVVIPVHLSGQPCDMSAIYALSQQYGFKVIEDASHAIGARYMGESVGNCRFSDITVFSFHPVKIVTSAEGGMVTTNCSELAHKMGLLRSHGITSDANEMQPRPADEIWNYQQIDLGFNYRMPDLNAALGLSQMQRLAEFVTRRQAIAQRYEALLADLPIQRPFQSEICSSSFHLYLIRLQLDRVARTHKQIYQALRDAGILVNLHYIPVYRQPYFAAMGFEAGYCPEAERYYAEVLSIPMYPALTDAMQDRVVYCLEKAVL